MDKKAQPKKQLSVIDRFRLGLIDKFTVPIKKDEEKKPKRKGEIRGGHKIRWLSHNEMLMHHKRIKRRRRRNEIAKTSRKRNRT